MILDERAVDLLDEFYHLDKPGVNNVPMAIEKSKKESSSATKKIPYKRKYDETVKKLVKSLESNNELLERLNDSNTELQKARKELADSNLALVKVTNQMEEIRQRNVWQRIRNK